MYGSLAALAAEAVFMSMVALVASLRDKDPWKVVKVPGSFLIGPEATRPEGFVVGDVLLGLLMHLFFAVVVGILYARLLPVLGISPLAGGLVAAGLLYGFGFWLLPLLFPVWLGAFWLPVGGKVLQAVAHIAYGLVLALTYQLLISRGRSTRVRGGTQ